MTEQENEEEAAVAKYAERYVAFVDILGFSDIIANSVQSERQVAALAKLLTAISNREDIFGEETSNDFRFVQFSDSIVMSCQATSLGLQYLLVAVSDLALSLLKNGILMRGGISKGPLYHEGHIAFGPAFIRAYMIESKIAKYPRVVLDKSVWDDFKTFAESEVGWERRLIRISDDGPAYVNVLLHLKIISEFPYPENFRYLESAAGFGFANLSGILESLLANAMHDPSQYEKVKWFSVYWNGYVGIQDGPFRMATLPTLPLNMGGQAAE